MSPLEYIEQGIVDGNWKFVCEGYKQLTNKVLPLPMTITKTHEALREIAIIIHNILPQDYKVKSRPIKKKSGCHKRNNKKKSSTTTEWEDTSLQLDDNDRTSIQKEVGGIRLITNDPNPDEIRSNKVKAAKAQENKTKLNRPPIRTYKVECNECGEKFESERPNGKMGQKCRKCLNDKKDRFVR